MRRKASNKTEKGAVEAATLEVTHTIALDPPDWYLAPWRKLPPLPLTDSAVAAFHKSAPAVITQELHRQGINAPDERSLDLILDTAGMNRSWNAATFALEWFLNSVLPYLPREVLEGRRDQFRQELNPAAWPTDPRRRPSPACYLAGAAGLFDEVLALVSSWPDDAYGKYDWDDYYHQPQFVVFALGSAGLVSSHLRRLRLRLKKPTHARAWLAHTGLSDLDYLRDCLAGMTNKRDAEQVFEVFGLVRAPEAAPHMLELRLGSKVQKLAGQWFDENPGSAIAGLIPVAGERGKTADAAIAYLRDAKKKGAAGFIEEQLKSAPPEAAERVRREVLEHVEKVYEPLTEKTTPRRLSDALSAAPATAKLPAFADPARLPPLLVEGRRLSDAHVSAVLAALRASPLGSPHSLVTALKEHADRASLDAFAWHLFELWLGDGAPAKEKWALLAVGHLGGDAAALKLTPLLRAWPGESQHQRAVTGLECLRAIGSDTALMQLNGIAQKLKFKGLQNKAKEFMEAIAKDRKLTRDQLEDRIVPDLGLDQRGGRTFDFGPRRFELLLGPDLRPLVRGEDRKPREDLPKPGAKDDAAKASAAAAEWKVLKKALREAAKVQAFRLEQAMVVGRRWTPDEFRTLLVRHPLMVNLVRRLLWAGYGAKGKLVRTFRVTEEGEYADADDRPCALDGVASVGVVHPLRLSEKERARWGQVFGDYEIIPPFPQLGRPVYTLDAAEAREKEITRFTGKKLPAASLWGTLERLGWTRGVPQDAGFVNEHTKSFPAAGVTAVLGYEIGVPIGAVQDWEDQRLTGVYFIETPAERSWLGRNKALPLGQVDAVAVSEVVADLAFLASKAE